VALTTKTTRSLVFVCRAYIPDALQPKDYRAWPFTVPCVAELAAHGLEFTRPVTFLVGDNGSGKSTLVEAIAEGFNLDSHGGQAAAKTGRPNPEKTALGAVLRLETTTKGARMLAGPRLKKKGFFSPSRDSVQHDRELGWCPRLLDG
jgi:predicted ATPase